MLSEKTCPDTIGKSRLSARLVSPATAGSEREVKASFAGKTLFTFLVFIFLLTTVQAQEVIVTLSGNSSTEGFSVKDSDLDTHFRVRGDGNIGIGTTTPGFRLHVADASPGGSVTGGTVLLLENAILGGTNIQMRSPKNGIGGLLFGDSDNPFRGGIRYSHFGEKLLLLSGGFNRLTIESNGDVGIGTTSPQNLLQVGIGDESIIRLGLNPQLILERNVSSNKFKIQVTGTGFNDKVLQLGRDDQGHDIAMMGDVGIGTTSPNFKLDVRGDIGNNATLHHSDIRWKKNVQSLPNSLEKITRLRGVSFEWRQDEFAEMNFPEGQRIGLIAQEVEGVIPELVSTAADGYKSVAYANLVAVLIEAVKEQQKQIEALERRINSLTLKEIDRTSYGYTKINMNK